MALVALASAPVLSLAQVNPPITENPTVSITGVSEGATIKVGETITLTAVATDGRSPYVYSWDFGSGQRAFGQQTTWKYTTTGPKTIILTVGDSQVYPKTGTASLHLNVGMPAPAVSDLSASITSPANGATYNKNQTISFSANATGGQSPYTFNWNYGDGTSGFGANATHGYTTAGSKTITLSVTDFTGTVKTASITLTINEGSQTDTTAPTQPVITSFASSTTNGSTTITWSASTDAGSGVAGYSYLWDNNPTTIPDNTVDSANLWLNQTLANGTWYFHIKALDNSGNASAVTHYGPIVISTGSTSNKPVISNIRVTDITQTSAIIRWTTNIPANSRVIYDTTSHADITGQSAPNFGYPNSTATFDNDTKVTEHAVPVTGLSSSTKYYFRVLSQS